MRELERKKGIWWWEIRKIFDCMKIRFKRR